MEQVYYISAREGLEVSKRHSSSKREYSRGFTKINKDITLTMMLLTTSQAAA